MPDIVYQSKQKFSIISSHSFDINYLKKLFNIVYEINKEAADLAVAELKRTSTQSEQELEKLKSLYKVEAHIWDAKGNYIVLDSESMFDDKLPNDITLICIDNTSYYKVNLHIDPSFKIIIQFDFSKSPIFDIITNPSLTTTNKNYVHIFGTKETWVSGAYEKIISSIKEKETNIAWLYKTSVYDLLLWFLFMPFILWNLFKYDSIFDSIITKLIGHKSIPLEIILYLYLILMILFLFRILFNYAKWVFPYTELITSNKNKSTTHRNALYAIIVFIMGALNPWLQDLIKSTIINYFSK